MSDRKPTDWAAVATEFKSAAADPIQSILLKFVMLQMLDYLPELIGMRGRERCAVRAFTLVMKSEGAHQVFGWPRVSAIRPEFQLKGGRRADLVIAHEDGSLTVVEVKGGPDLTAVAGGIGQALLYAELLREMRPGVTIRCALVVGDHFSATVANVCEAAGVEYIPVGDEDAVMEAGLRALIKRFREVRLACAEVLENAAR